MDAKATATGIAEALADVHTAIDESDRDAVIEAATVLHKRMRAGLYRHGEALGLSSEDIAEIDNLGPQRRGGEPKEQMPTAGGE